MPLLIEAVHHVIIIRAVLWLNLREKRKIDPKYLRQLSRRSLALESGKLTKLGECLALRHEHRFLDMKNERAQHEQHD